MGLETIGSLNQYLKSVRQEHQWQMKQAGNPSPVLGTGVSRTSVLFVKSITSKKSGLSKSQIQKKLQKIKNKLRSGAKLTGEELDFLRRYAPELYRKVAALQKERENYEQRLKQAKTRDEAEQIKMEKMAQSVASADKEDSEFGLIRLAQFMAAEEETRKEVSIKPWKRELNKEKRERLERAAKDQAHRERKMKKLRRWDGGKVKEEASDKEQEEKVKEMQDKISQNGENGQEEESFRKVVATGEPLVDAEAVTRGALSVDEAEKARQRVEGMYGEEQASLQMMEARIEVLGENFMSGGTEQISGFSKGKAAYSAMATQMAGTSQAQDGDGKYTRRA